MNPFEVIKKLEEALKPFAKDDFCEALGGNVEGPDSPIYQRQKSILKLSDFQKAKEALDTLKHFRMFGE